MIVVASGNKKKKKWPSIRANHFRRSATSAALKNWIAAILPGIGKHIRKRVKLEEKKYKSEDGYGCRACIHHYVLPDFVILISNLEIYHSH